MYNWDGIEIAEGAEFVNLDGLADQKWLAVGV